MKSTFFNAEERLLDSIYAVASAGIWPRTFEGLPSAEAGDKIPRQLAARVNDIKMFWRLRDSIKVSFDNMSCARADYMAMAGADKHINKKKPPPGNKTGAKGPLVPCFRASALSSLS